MTNSPRSSRSRRASAAAMSILAALALAALTAVALAANPGTATTGAGQPLNIRIDAPKDGANVPAQELAVNGVAGIGPLSGGAGGTNLMYAVDNSGSTGATGGDCNGDGATNAGDDVNGDGSVGTVLDCEISGVLALNASLAGSGIASGIVAFGSAADGGDMSPSAGQQDFTGVSADANGNNRSDVEDVARTITRSGIGVFTPFTTSGGGTSFNSALTKMNAAFASQVGKRNIGAFLSDGQDTVTEGAGSPLDAARAAGTRINTYSVGSSAAGCAPTSSLKKIADTTGGTCTEVTDPTKLSGTIAGGASSAGLQGVQVSVNGGAAVAANVTSLGNWSTKVPGSSLRSGSNRVSATVTATDGTKATAQVTVNVGGGTTTGTIGLPSNKRCISKRLFPIQIRQRRGLRYDFATVVVNRKKVRVYVRTKKRWIRTGRPSGKLLNVRLFKAYVDLRGLAKGRYTVKIVVVATNGRVITGTRKYRTCTRRLRGSIPKL